MEECRRCFSWSDGEDAVTKPADADGSGSDRIAGADRWSPETDEGWIEVGGSLVRSLEVTQEVILPEEVCPDHDFKVGVNNIREAVGRKEVSEGLGGPAEADVKADTEQWRRADTEASVPVNMRWGPPLRQSPGVRAEEKVCLIKKCCFTYNCCKS